MKKSKKCHSHRSLLTNDTEGKPSRQIWGHTLKKEQQQQQQQQKKSKQKKKKKKKTSSPKGNDRSPESHQVKSLK